VSNEWQFITLQILSEYFLVSFDRYHQQIKLSNGFYPTNSN